MPTKPLSVENVNFADPAEVDAFLEQVITSGMGFRRIIATARNGHRRRAARRGQEHYLLPASMLISVNGRVSMELSAFKHAYDRSPRNPFRNRVPAEH